MTTTEFLSRLTSTGPNSIAPTKSELTKTTVIGITSTIVLITGGTKNETRENASTLSESLSTRPAIISTTKNKTRVTETKVDGLRSTVTKIGPGTTLPPTILKSKNTRPATDRRDK